jgi:hypothetical protein
VLVVQDLTLPLVSGSLSHILMDFAIEADPSPVAAALCVDLPFLSPDAMFCDCLLTFESRLSRMSSLRLSSLVAHQLGPRTDLISEFRLYSVWCKVALLFQ